MTPDPVAPPDAMTSNARAWTDAANWSGDDYTGPGLPPWGTKPRCPVVRNGRRCKKACIPGGTVCNTHGGAAPQVKRRAQLRLLSLVDPALGALARTLGTTQDDGLRVKIAFGILDRTGLGKATDVSADVAKGLLMERYYALREKDEEERRERAKELETMDAAWEEVEDAEVVGDRAEPSLETPPASAPTPAPGPTAAASAPQPSSPEV